jgi:DNA-binding LytR/AlgR family response regulator
MNPQNLITGLNNERIILKCSRSVEFIKVKKIIRAESLRSYCKLYVIGEKPLVFSYPLKILDERLSSYQIFFRSHKSHLINLLYVKNYHGDHGIKMTDGSCIPLAITMKSAFLKKTEELFCGKIEIIDRTTTNP